MLPKQMVPPSLDLSLFFLVSSSNSAFSWPIGLWALSFLQSYDITILTLT